jgi:sigma-B regulation protein RsbU (phosphoserine phosphatase)
MKPKGLATKLIVSILPSTAIIFLAAFAYNYQVSQEAVLAKVAESARHLTLETANKIEVVLKGVEKVPGNLAAIIEDYPYDRQDLVRLLHSVMEGNLELYGVALAFEPFAFDPKLYYFCPYGCREGDRIKVSFLGGDSYRYFYWDWYQVPKELNRPLWSEPYFDEGGGNIIMSTFSMPFYEGPDGIRKFKGVVTADLSLNWLQNLVSSAKILQTGYAFLISQNGLFVTHPELRLIMRESIFSVAEARGDPELRRIGQSMISGGSGMVPITDFVSGEKSWMYYAPLPATGWSLGVVFPDNELLADVRVLSLKLVSIGLAGLLFIGLVIIVISGTVARPLKILAHKTTAIAQGDFTATVPETGTREIAHLGRSFNEMGRQLTDYIEKRDFIRDTFGRYVTQEVVKRLLESKESLELGGETREVSIIMSDLRGFTAITADMDPEEVITFLNRYLGKMIEILVDHRAVIDEIIGDGILAFFGAPEPLDDHPARAVACALAMQAAMDEINAANETDGLPHLEMGIAVNTGAVVVGNIGSEKRMKYSVVGAHVNFTGRMESYSVGGQVLVSPSTYQRVQDLVEVRDTLQVQMKGVPRPATLYDVRGISGPYEVHLKDRREHLLELPQKMMVRLYRISEKIVRGTIEVAWITHLCDTAAQVHFEGELKEWEDIRLHLLDEAGAEIPGKIYGKVTLVQAAEEGRHQATIRFTSVSPEIYQIIQRTVHEGADT